MENCDVGMPYVCKDLDVDELNINAVIRLSLNCRNITASNHFEFIGQLLLSFRWTFYIAALTETWMSHAESHSLIFKVI